MLTFRTLVMFAAATIATVEGPIPLRAQSAPMANQPDSVSIHVSLQKSIYAIGEKPIAVLTFISSNGIWFSGVYASDGPGALRTAGILIRSFERFQYPQGK
jgi:hypothetical protein